MKKRYRRTQNIQITKESLYLREVRLTKSLSIRKVAQLIGCSETLIRHIENGRLDVPKGDLLDQLLNIYEIPNRKAFNERLKRMKIEITPREELTKIIAGLNSEQIKIILSVVKGLAS